MLSNSPLLRPTDFEQNPPYVVQVIDDSNQECKLFVFIDRTLIRDQTAVETTTHLVVRRALQVTSIAASFIARIPFIQLNLKLGGDDKVYGAFLSYGTCASFGYLVAFSFLEIIDSQMKPLTREERDLLESRVGPTLKKVFFVSATTLGAVTQIPFAYIAYKYNDPSTLNPDGLVMPILTVAIDSWVSTYSTYMGLKAIGEKRSLNQYEKELSIVRGKMLFHLEENRQLLSLVDSETRSSFVDTFERIQNVEEASDRVQQFYTLCTRRISDQTLAPSNFVKGIDYVVQTYGYLCAGCNIGTLGYIAYLGTDAFASSLGLNITITALYVGTALYLNTTAIPKTASVLFNLAKDIFTCGYKPSISDRLTPKLSFTLKALGLATAALAYGMPIELSQEYYEEHEWLEVTMDVTLTSATTFLVSMAILSITDALLETKIEKLGSEDEKRIIKLYHKMKHFSSGLASSPLLETALFLKAIPPEALDQLIENTRITTENLEDYIKAHIPQAIESSRLITVD